MDSKIVSREIKLKIWPVLREAGFSKFSSRNAWRYSDWKIDVLNFQSFHPYLAAGVGCTTYSFAVNLGCHFNEVPYTYHGLKKLDGQALPHEYQCQVRSHLTKTFNQSELNRDHIWYIAPNGHYLNESLEDVRSLIHSAVLPWYERFADAKHALKTFLECDRHVIGLHKPSPLRSYNLGYIAALNGRFDLAIENLEDALKSGCFKNQEVAIKKKLESLRQS
jgi:hypothetical protein